MSKGFVKEDDQEAVPLVLPRAPLPAGVPNYVTPAGMSALLEEKRALLAEKKALQAGSEQEARIGTNFVNAKLQLLDARVASAVVVDPEASSGEEVRFGATITLRAGDEAPTQTFQIVGVDEADISQGKISFISPMARAMMNQSVGDEVSIKLPAGKRTLTLIDIVYGASPSSASLNRAS